MFILIFGYGRPTVGGIDRKNKEYILFAPKDYKKYSKPKNEAEEDAIIKWAKACHDKHFNGRGPFGPFGYVKIEDGPLKNLADKPELFNFLAKNIVGHTQFCCHCGAAFTPRSSVQKYCQRKECQTYRHTQGMRTYRLKLKAKKTFTS